MDKYLALARERGFNANMRIVPTPFINEDHSDSPHEKPCGDGPALYCPSCRHAFPYSESVSDEQLRATQRQLAKAGATILPECSASPTTPVVEDMQEMLTRK